MALDKLFGIGVLLSLQDRLSPVAASARKSLEQLEGQVDDLDERIKRLDGFDQWADRARNLSTYVSLPLVAAGAKAAEYSIQWESSFAGVRKTVNATQEEFDQLEAGLEQLAERDPIDPTDLNHIMELAGQLGVRGVPQLLKFTDVIAKLGVSTNLSAEEGATQLARFANIVQMPMDRIDRLGSTIVNLGNNMATTEAEIVEMGMRLAGAGHQIGLNEPQILGLAAALSSVGIEAEAGGSALSRVMIQMSSDVAAGGKQLALWATVAGKSVTDFRQEFKGNAMSAIVDFVGGLSRLQKAGGDVFGVLDALGIQDIRMRDAMLRLAGSGDVLTQALSFANQGWEQNLALQREAAQRFGTTESQLQLLHNEAFLTGRAFGDVITPILRVVAASWGAVLQKIRALPAPLKTGIVFFGGLMAVAFPLIWLFGTLASSLVALSTLMAAQAGPALIAANAIRAIGTAARWSFGALRTLTLFLATNPVGLALTGLATAAFVLAKAWEGNWFHIRDVAGEVVGWLQDRIEAFVGWLQNNPISRWIGGIIDKATSLFGGAKSAPPTPALAGAAAAAGSPFILPALPPAFSPATPRSPLPPLTQGDQIHVNLTLGASGVTPANAEQIGRQIGRGILREKEARPK